MRENEWGVAKLLRGRRCFYAIRRVCEISTRKLYAESGWRLLLGFASGVGQKAQEGRGEEDEGIGFGNG